MHSKVLAPASDNPHRPMVCQRLVSPDRADAVRRRIVQGRCIIVAPPVGTAQVIFEGARTSELLSLCISNHCVSQAQLCHLVLLILTP